MTIRPLTPGDVPAVQSLLTSIALFPPEMLPYIVAPALAGEDACRKAMTDRKAGGRAGAGAIRVEAGNDVGGNDAHDAC